MIKKKQLIVIAGPTAVGKTSMAIDLARHFDTEIISADSRQFFQEMNIGTAKPTVEELSLAVHHFVNNLSIEEDYDAGKFAEEAEQLLVQLFEKHDKVILVGGSGMYIKALCDGFDEMPEVPQHIRMELSETWATGNQESLLEELRLNDPEFYEFVDYRNKQRVTRALEVIRATGKSYSSFRKGKTKVRKAYSIVKIGLERERSELYQFINLRMDAMIDQGLFEEAESLYPFKELNALQTVGYREIFDYLDGKYDKEEAIRLLKRNSRRYAKRQMTWFKKDEEFKWFSPEEKEKIIKYIESQEQ
ncbi:tRNA (adenosine(37)-N6)-dimethylallyltransferase MiaA [Reichenbachiella sp. MALMAid0571]|uniref:tRNA (adenosine(37)-N6)-dimethylallyltransferase MiaA n=1 Tax=Reichenbachiella sp. MALMAid0571 TaxID=3143939 RepID=UPI0032DE7E44